MPLPDLIEIVPLNRPVRAEVTVPGSKSITNRALILAALADGEVTLDGALWSEDTQIMTECLQELGFIVQVADDPRESCNRAITVYGKGGAVPPGGTEEQPMELFVGNAGTAARFLSAFVCLGSGVYRLHGVPRMHERPHAALFHALRELGYRVESEHGNDKLPVRIWGEERAGAETTGSALKRSCRVSIEESSQFASALLLCARAGNWNIEMAGENAEESPYVAMSSKLVDAFPHRGGRIQIEPDASGGSYFWAAGWIAPMPIFERSDADNLKLQQVIANAAKNAELRPKLQAILGGSSPYYQWWKELPDLLQRFDSAGAEWLRSVRDRHSFVTVRHWPESKWQIDAEFPSAGRGHPVISRKHDLGDSIMTSIVLAPFEPEPVIFTDLGRLRVQECERVAALRTELAKCGAKVLEKSDTLTVYPGELHGAEIDTYNDHRMAMCFAILGLKVAGIKLKNPACVKKTFPNFFQKLAGAPPDGLGATVREGATGRALAHDELFAG